MKNEFKVGEIVKVLVNGKHRLRGEIIDIKNDVATVAVPVYYGNYVEYIPVESELDDLWSIINGIGDIDVR